MKKQLSDLTLKELWELFPVILKEHNPAYHEWYLAEQEKITACVGLQNMYRISHIGSSAVRGLLTKPTVDILLEVMDSCDEKQVCRSLTDSGWLVMSPGDGDGLRMVFNKGYTPDGLAEKSFHLHLREPGDWDELYFRDYLILHKDAADAYASLKKSLQKQYEHDRDSYTAAKTEFILEKTELARKEFGAKYTPQKK